METETEKEIKKTYNFVEMFANDSDDAGCTNDDTLLKLNYLDFYDSDCNVSIDEDVEYDKLNKYQFYDSDCDDYSTQLEKQYLSA